MKRIIKDLLSLTIVLSFFFLLPSNVNALSVTSAKVPINEATFVQTDELVYSNIKFYNNTNKSSRNYGITGTLTNNSSTPKRVEVTINYYDNTYNLKKTNTKTKNISANSTITYTHMFDLESEVTADYVSEFAYYEVVMTTENTTGNTQSNKKPSEESTNYSRGYVIDAYDVNIKVNIDNTFDITETITAYFFESRHGIYRKIPKKNRVTRLDGTKTSNTARITNISVDNEYTSYTENSNLVLQIGNADKTITGPQTYVIKYTYNIGNDKMSNYDELYFNIIGTEWDTVIGNITFTIDMPKEFDTSKLGFSSGSYGSTVNHNVEYTIVGNKITGSYNGTLGVASGLTVRCELEEGYFEKQEIKIETIHIIFMIIPILLALVSVWLWSKYGKDDPVVETVEFYPPAGLNSLEVGFLYKGLADNQDVTSLLIYLANKGYIKIIETEEAGLFGTKKSFKITKLKEYDGNNINELTFLKGLFAPRPKISSLFKNDPSALTSLMEVTETDLYNSFYVTMNQISRNINGKENMNKIFEKTSTGKTGFVGLMIIAIYLIITIPPLVVNGESDLIFPALLFPGFGFTFMFSSVFGKPTTVYVNGKTTRSKATNIIFGLLFGGMFGGIPWAAMVLPSLLMEPMYLLIYIIGLISIAVITVALTYLPKRTPYGNEMLGKIGGFKTYLETAEKTRLEAMVMQNPTYFYDILPYAYVLGVSDTWVKKFGSIAIQAPTWYAGRSAFSMHTFNTFMTETMTSAQRSMSSSPSSSSSGGGSSGGGSGGGGGGSW